MTDMTKEEATRYSAALNLLDQAADWLGDQVPDKEWFKDYFLLTGVHMILTEDGWEPGSARESYLADDPEWEPLDEVNTPKSAPLVGGRDSRICKAEKAVSDPTNAGDKT